MVDIDELEWQRRVHGESQEAAYIQAMRNSQQEAEHRVKCAAFVATAKELRKQYPNDQQFGRIIAEILRREDL